MEEVSSEAAKNAKVAYLRLLHQPVGLLNNIGALTFKEGMKRIVKTTLPSRLRAFA